MSRSRPGPNTGLSAIALRRCCLGIVALGSVGTVAYRPALSIGLLAGLMLLVQGGLVSGALQRVQRHVRVGYAATVTGLATSVLLALGLALAPRKVGSVSMRVPTDKDPANPADILRPDRELVDVDAYSSPVRALFGGRPTTSTSPSLPLSIVVMFVAILGACVLWALVARLGRERGVLEPHTGDGALASGATLAEPLGTSVTRPAAASRPNPVGRPDVEDSPESVGRPFPTTSSPLRLPPQLPGKRRER